MRGVVLGLVLLLGLAAGQGRAVEPSEMLADPVLETRAREISKDLRCLVCQNQSIDDSNAELARDLRVLVRRRLVAGDSDNQVIDYVVSRYGDFVLLNPPFKGATYALWLGPGLIAALGLLAVVVFFRRRRSVLASGEAVPSNAAKKPRSAAAARCELGWSIFATSARTLPSSSRISKPMDPWQSAGSQFSRSRSSQSGGWRFKRARPARARKMPSASPATSFSNRV